MREKRNLMWRFAKYYLLVLILPLLVSLYVYYTGVRIVEADTYAIQDAMLTQTIQSVEQGLREMEKLAVQVASNPLLNEQARRGNQGKGTVLELDDCIREMNKYFVSDSLVADCYVFFPNAGYVMTRETLYRTELFYSHYLRYPAQLYDEWLALLDAPRVPGDYVDLDGFYGDGEDNPHMAFVTTMPFYKGRARQATLVVLCRKSDIAVAFPREDAEYCIFGGDGRVVLASPKMGLETIALLRDQPERHAVLPGAGGNMISVQAEGALGGWRYALLRPESVAFAHLRGYRRIFFLVLAAGLAVGMVGLLLVSYRNTKPLYHLVESLKKHDGTLPPMTSGNAYAIIAQGVDKLIHAQDDLMRGLQQQIPMVKNDFIQNLLHGLLYSEQDAQAQAQYLGMLPSEKGGLFQVAVFQLEAGAASEERQRLYSARTALTQHIGQQLQDVYFVFHIDYRTVAVALYAHAREEMRRRLEQFAQGLDLEVAFLVGVGAAYSQLSEIWLSFDQAMIGIGTMAFGADRIAFLEDRPQYSEQSYYSIEVEQHLVGYVKAGEWENAKQLLDILYDENFKKRILSPVAVKGLFTQLKGSVYRILDRPVDESLEQIVQSINPSVTPEQSFHYLKQAYKYIISSDKTGRKRQADAIAEDIRSYVENNYMLSTLNLAMAAAHFHLSEGYFSFFFKENIGVPFTDYVETIRIQKAVILLSDSRLSINEISVLCGYNSAQSFRRAFKRITGHPPTTLRQQ